MLISNISEKKIIWKIKTKKQKNTLMKQPCVVMSDQDQLEIKKLANIRIGQ
jgi:hypothetical protein